MAVGAGLFVTGVWQIDQLDRPRLSIALGQPPPPPSPPAGGPVAAVTNIDVTPKPPPRRPPPVVVQPYDKPHAKPEEPGPDLPPGSGGPDGPESPCVDNCGPAAPAIAAVCGNNSLEVGEQCDDGNTISNDGCSATCQTEPKPKPATAVISPVVMNGLRISGNTQVHPSESSQSRMSRDGKTKIVGSVHLCMSTDGSIASVAMAKPTQYDEYDQALLSAVRGWRYRPYTVNGVAVKACSMVTFIYTIH